MYIADYRVPYQQPQVSVHFNNIESDISGACILKLLWITLIKLPATCVLHKLQLDIDIQHLMYFCCGKEVYITHTESINVVLQITIVTCKVMPLL